VGVIRVLVKVGVVLDLVAGHLLKPVGRQGLQLVPHGQLIKHQIKYFILKKSLHFFLSMAILNL
ncbi:MAG: hypothetical protein II037_06995, partial [Bacteroidales bacterium]|nr:hypothetical protein [Bacteroidales bacterium]